MIFVEPPLANLEERRRVKVVELLPAVPEGDDEVGGLQQGKMFGHSLPRHIELLAQLTQGLPVVVMQLI